MVSPRSGTLNPWTKSSPNQTKRFDMSITTPVEYEDLMLPEAIKLETRIYDDLEDLDGDRLPIAVNNRYFLQTLLTQVQDRIGHLTSMLVF